MTQLAQGLGFDLPDAFARNRERLADFLERVLTAIIQAEAHLDDFFFAGCQRLQHGRRLFLQVQIDDRIGWRYHRLVFDEVAEMRIFLFADRGFERDRLLGDLQNLAHLGHGNVHALGDFFAGRLAAELLHELAAGAHELVDGLDHVHRDADGARLVGDRTGDGLTDPPCRVSRKLVTAAPLELVHGFHQADVTFLNQVEKLQSAVGVLLGDGNNQSKVGLDQFLLGLLGFRFAAVNQRQRALQLRETDFAGLFDVFQLSAARAQFLARFRGDLALGHVGATLQAPRFAFLSMYFSVCLVLLAIFSSVSSSSSNWTISLMERTPLRRSSPTAISSLITMGERVMDFMTTSCPRSMRLAMVTSPSRVSSGTVPISRRYMRTGSFFFSSNPALRSTPLSPSRAPPFTT